MGLPIPTSTLDGLIRLGLRHAYANGVSRLTSCASSNPYLTWTYSASTGSNPTSCDCLIILSADLPWNYSFLHTSGMKVSFPISAEYRSLLVRRVGRNHSNCTLKVYNQIKYFRHSLRVSVAIHPACCRAVGIPQKKLNNKVQKVGCESA
jgi:hypothetical protein